MKSNPPLSTAPIAAAPPKSMFYSIIISLLSCQSLRIVILRADLSKSVYDCEIISVLSLSLVTSFTGIVSMLMEASFIHRRSLLQVVAVVPVAVALAFIAFPFQRDRFVLNDFLKS